MADPKTEVVVELIGQDGNVFNLIGVVSRELKRGGHRDLAQEFRSRAMRQPSYNDVLNLIQAYVTIE